MVRKEQYKRLMCIYKITNPKGCVYIGQTKNLDFRIYKYIQNKALGQQKLHNSIIKYGLNQHSVEVLRECFENEIDYWESRYIKEYDSINNGLNIRAGGGTKKRTHGKFFNSKDKNDAYLKTIELCKKLRK